MLTTDNVRRRSSHSSAGDRDHAMTSVGICASVVSGAKILVRDRLLKVPENRGVVIPGCGRGYQSGGRRPIDEPTDRLTLQSLPETRYFFVVARCSMDINAEYSIAHSHAALGYGP